MIKNIITYHKKTFRIFKRNIVNKGHISKSPKWFLEIVATAVEEAIFDKKYKIDTGRSIGLDSLKIDSQNKPRGGDYGATRVRPFKKLMNLLTFPKESVFVDFGCGKGRALLLASFYNFKKIVGVEFSPELCKIARENILIYKKKRNIQGNIEVVESDCVEYGIKDDENVFFFFNPFDAIVMRKVMENIYNSLMKNNRKIWLIYNNPKWRMVIEEYQSIFYKEMEYRYDGCEFFIYTNVSLNAP
jgi:SAM-dependent methyltransferase